ncbi:MAG: glycyl-radical enzyme activating protein [Desulfosarcinaceae bacterium]
MTKGIVFKIKKFALHDGPGIRTTVFFKGCPLGCWWCHNPEGISPEPQIMRGRRETVAGEQMSVDQVLAEILKDRLFYEESGGGVTFSGGEPTMQPLFLEGLLQACRAQGLHTAIDTSGHAPVETFLRLAGLADLVLFDLKLIDPARHKRFTGVDNHLILDNFRALGRTHPAVRVRLPLIPGVTDDEENIRAVAEVAHACKGLAGADLLPYHRIGDQKYDQLGMERRLADLATPTPGAVSAAQSLYRKYGLSVSLGG